MPTNELPAAWDKNIDRDMSLTEHLQDLRACLLKALAAFAAGTCVSFYFADEIMQLATSAASNLYYMRPAEAFIIYMKLILLSGLVLASPIILYQLYSFIRPALTARERIFMLLCLPVTLCLFLGGMLFSYNFVFPRGLEFFLGFAAGKVNPLISMESYLDFMLMLVVPFGFVFNIPVVLLLLCYLRLVHVATLVRYQRHIILAAFILAAFITPTPDIITQCLLALPMVILYEISIYLCKFLITENKEV